LWTPFTDALSKSSTSSKLFLGALSLDGGFLAGLGFYFALLGVLTFEWVEIEIGVAFGAGAVFGAEARVAFGVG